MKGLKTTYYLRTLAASQIEKSTLDANKYGFTQNRKYDKIINEEDTKIETSNVLEKDLSEKLEIKPAPKLCLIDDPDCEACQ